MSERDMSGLAHAKAKALAEELFGPNATVIRDLDPKGVWRWAILFPPKPSNRPDWAVVGVRRSGNSLLLRVERLTGCVSLRLRR